MEWLVDPFKGFGLLDDEEIAGGDTCSGGGTLHSCDTKGALIICTCTGGLVVKAAETN